MTTPTFQFNLVARNGISYSGKVESLTVPGEKGSFGVLANHAALISTCVPGKLKVLEKPGVEFYFQTNDGFFEVTKNRSLLLTDSAEKLTL